jgi:mRNA interferase RelE/StbE
MASAHVRFTDAAIEDLKRLHKKDPQIVRSVLKKCLLIEENPYAGKRLLGDLVGYRRLVVGNRDWRIVWQVIEAAGLSVDIAEIWAAGARADDDVYREMKERIATMPDDPLTVSLGEVVELLAPGAEIRSTHESVEDPIPDWLRTRLIRTAGVHHDRLEGISGEEAMGLWERFMRGESV